uniref:Hydantoinase n=1 Tax=Acrobeloides nanus TaxID=290746 RepID=A0A914DBE8_9BILA
MACVIGIDVGGTNTDAVVVKNREILAWTKVTTTKDVTTGVLKAIHGVLAKLKPQDVTTGVLKAIHGVLAKLKPQELKLQQINLGTTHFVNSIVQRSPELAKVGVIRIATKPNTSSVPAFFDFPRDLVQLIDGGYCIVSGGCEFDGSETASIAEEEILQEVENFLKKNVKNLVLISTFATVKSSHEEKAYEIIQKNFGNSISCTLSHKIGQLGFIERENASILNESLKPLCQKTLRNFKSALEKLNLKCPLFVSQNDGTIVRSNIAIENPVFTFASGPTNSMRGAAFVSGVKDAIVLDI